MNENKENSLDNEIEVKKLLLIIIKQKWWLIGTIIIVFIFGFLFSFFRPAQYGLDSNIVISNQYLYHNNLIYRLFPEYGEKLWILPDEPDLAKAFENKFLDYMTGELQSESVLNEVHNRFDNNIDMGELKEGIYVLKDDAANIITLRTIFPDKNNAYDVNKEILNVYLSIKRASFDELRKKLLEKVDLEILSTEKILDELSEQLNSGNEELLSNEINLYISDKKDLKELRDILENNKELFTERIVLLNEPDLFDIQQYYSLIRDLIFTMITAIVAGLIVAFLVNSIQLFKNRSISK